MTQMTLPDSDIIKCMILKKPNISIVTKNVIHETIVLKAVNILKDEFFTALIDESVNVSEIKTLCIFLRYVYTRQANTKIFSRFVAH
jgi:hypothetical protein